eukprot:279267-Rhodomonas_salina.1
MTVTPAAPYTRRQYRTARRAIAGFAYLELGPKAVIRISTLLMHRIGDSGQRGIGDTQRQRETERHVDTHTNRPTDQQTNRHPHSKTLWRSPDLVLEEAGDADDNGAAQVRDALPDRQLLPGHQPVPLLGHHQPDRCDNHRDRHPGRDVADDSRVISAVVSPPNKAWYSSRLGQCRTSRKGAACRYKTVRHVSTKRVGA